MRAFDSNQTNLLSLLSFYSFCTFTLLLQPLSYILLRLYNVWRCPRWSIDYSTTRSSLAQTAYLLGKCSSVLPRRFRWEPSLILCNTLWRFRWETWCFSLHNWNHALAIWHQFKINMTGCLRNLSTKAISPMRDWSYHAIGRLSKVFLKSRSDIRIHPL